MELMQANRQWSSRPADERFTSLHALAAFTRNERANSARRTLSNRGVTVLPSTSDPLDIAVALGKNGKSIVGQFTHWSFGQLASLADVPAAYIRNSGMPGALAADNVNWGLHHSRSVEDVSVLIRKRYDANGENGAYHIGAFNGPNYGPVWNADIADTLVLNYGDGVTGPWRVPGEFGEAVPVTRENTTLYASDRDMWVFLADETNRVEIPNRRNGASGSLARGFFVGNSEVGAQTLRLGMFLFDYVCCNRIIWGAQDFTEIKVRHTSSAPDRWLEEVRPILRAYAEAPAAPVAATIAAAQQAKIKTDVDTFLATRFGKGIAASLQAVHMLEEQRPIETIWDAVTGATAYARRLEHVDARVKIEKTAGDLLKLAA
jgi:hypothetical protein